jgi:two-component system cell cycle sensor histidine kinase/response regulator CckA
MQDKSKTKNELIDELSQLRLKIAEFERAKNDYIQTEKILQVNEKKYHSLVEFSSDFLLELDPEGNYLFVSPGVKDLLGYEPCEMLGKKALDFMPPQEAIRVGKAYSEFVKSKAKVFNFEHIFLHKNGREVIVESNGLPVTDEAGQMLGYTGFSRDITKRKQAEEALRKHALMVDQAYDSIISTDLHGNVTSWNKGAEKMFGYPPDEALGRHISFIYPDDQHEFLQREVITPLKQKSKHETEVILRRKSGQNFYGLLALSLLKAENGAVIGMLGSSVDITERKNSELALQKSEDKFSKAFHSGSVIMIISTVDDGRFIDVNNEFLKVFGYSKEEVIGKTSREINIFKDYKQREFMVREIQEKGFIKNYEIHSRTKNDELRVCLISTDQIETDKEKYLLTTMNDITERKQAEEALRESEKRFKDLLEMLPEAIFETDRNINLTFANRRAFELFGYSKEDFAQGLNGLELIASEDRERVKANMALRLKGEDPGTVEYQAVKKDGSTFPILFHANSIMKDGKLAGVRGIIVDITERKQAEEALRQSEEKYRNLFQNSLEGIGMSKENQVINANPALLEIFGYDNLNEFKKIPLLDHVAPESRDLIINIMQTGKDDEQFKKRFEYKIIRKDGEKRDLEISLGKIILNDETYTISTFHDITENKKAESALRDSEEKYRAIVAAFDGLICTYSQDYRIEFINQHYIDRLGFDPTGQLCYKALQNRDDICPWCINERICQGESVRRERKSEKDGRWYYNSNTPIFHADGTISKQSLVIDITERKAVEEALAAEKQRLDDIIRATNVGTWESNVQTGESIFNERWAEIIGYALEEISPVSIDTWQKFAHPDDFKMSDELLKRHFNGELDYYECKVRMRHKNGDWIWVFVQGKIVTWTEDGRPLIMAGTHQDITERKRAEEELRQRQEMISALIETSKDWIWAIDLEGVHTYCNPAIEKILGYHAAELFVKNSFSLIHEDDRQLARKTIEMCIADKRGWNNLLIRWQHKDGSWRYLESNSVPIFDQKGKIIGFWGVDRDITERKRAEEEREKLQEQLIHAKKMESIGRLAGGVAHDFNNLLTAIIGHSELIESGLKPDDPLLSDIKVVQQASDRAAQLTSQLLAFSRKQAMHPKIVNINKIINDMLNMLKRIIGEDIEFNILMSDDIRTIMVDPGQMEQVIVNMAVNARDAMQAGGMLTIKTSNIEVDEDIYQTGIEIKSGKYVLLSISDTGSGISDEIKTKIFEPFFTTKESGKGTGLGLSTVYGIVKQSVGQIAVDSRPGSGSTFNIYLPAVENPGNETVTASKKAELPKGSETILIVEDDEIVRNIAAEILKKSGYWVIATSSGKEALDVCARLDKPVDLVITDVIMPNMSGSEFAKELKNIWPEFKLLYISGYSNNDIGNQGPMIRLLQKPFHPGELVLKVRQLLDNLKPVPQNKFA